MVRKPQKAETTNGMFEKSSKKAKQGMRKRQSLMDVFAFATGCHSQEKRDCCLVRKHLRKAQGHSERTCEFRVVGFEFSRILALNFKGQRKRASHQNETSEGSPNDDASCVTFLGAMLGVLAEDAKNKVINSKTEPLR